MDKDFLIISIFLMILVSLTMYVNELGIHEVVEAKFFDFGGEEVHQNAQTQDGSEINVAHKGDETAGALESYTQSKKFKIEVLEIKETALLTREIKAKLTDNYADVKNVKIRFELMLDGERIKINGKDYLTVYIGDMKKGENAERVVEVGIDFFDGIKIRNRGYVDAILTVLYDGGLEIIKYRLNI